MRPKTGIFLLAIKLVTKFGPKLFSVLIKLAKGLKVGKLGLAGASMASYALLFTWEFAAVIMVMLFIHESGHIWAMKRYGVKTKGIYFLPFLGGAAVADEAFPSREAEVYIAIMGPIWGLALSITVAVIYTFTLNPFFAAVAGWMAMINLFNLLPINPLDGGRILKSIAFSVHSGLGFIFLLIGIYFSGWIAFSAGLYLFVVLLIVGTIELAYEYMKLFSTRTQIHKENLENTIARFKGDFENYEFVDPEHFEGLQKGAIRPLERELKALTTHPRMMFGDIAISAFAYLVVAAVLYGLMYQMSHIPAASAAMQVLTS